MKKPLPNKDQFFNMVTPEPNTGCWLWDGYVDNLGYGRIWAQGLQSAHRLSYFIHYGAFPKEKHVLHSCDNPLCANPQHLFLGDHKSNMKDKMDKGRWSGPFGERHHKASMSLELAKKIKETYDSNNYSAREVAEMFSVPVEAAKSLCYGITWKRAFK